MNFFFGEAEISSFLTDNIDWIFPLFVTILLTVISLRNERRQKQLAEYEVGISLMEKRLTFYNKESKVLEKIICKSEPSQAEIDELCHAEHEVIFLFGDEVKEHIDKVLRLVDEFHERKTPTTPDGFGGCIMLSDEELNEYVKRATELFGEAISIYQPYIDFSSIGLTHSKK